MFCVELWYRACLRSTHHSHWLWHYSWAGCFTVVTIISCFPALVLSSPSLSSIYTVIFLRYPKFPYLSFLSSNNEYKNHDAKLRSLNLNISILAVCIMITQIISQAPMSSETSNKDGSMLPTIDCISVPFFENCYSLYESFQKF